MNDQKRANAREHRRGGRVGRDRTKLKMRRPWRYGPSFSDEENTKVLAAARRSGLTTTGYIATAALTLADTNSGDSTPGPAPLSDRAVFEALAELQTELFDTRTAVVRTGTNLNQAVAALNATGQAPQWLVTVASMCARTLAGVDEVISAIDARVRR